MTQTNSNFEPQDLINLALDGQSNDYKVKVLTVALKAKIEPNDPLFLVLMATGRLELMLLDAPQNLKQIFEENLNKAAHLVQESGSAALQTQKAAIAGAVSTLMKRQQADKGVPKASQSDLSSGIKLASAVVLSLAIGGFIGNAMAISSQGGYLGKVNLTAQQAEALGWAQSKEGKFARDIMRWNADSLENKQCKSEATQLGVTLEINGRKAKDGFCTIWVEPANRRKFVQSQTQVKK